jgi:LysM repeat protein
MKRAAATAAVATVGVIGFGSVAGASPAASAYTVQPGDTLSRIAPDNWREVAAGNGIENPDLIFVGQVIDLDATAPAPAYQSSQSSSDDSSSQAESAPAPEAAPAAGSSGSGSGVWDQLAQCESGGDWSINTGNGYYGGLQFSLSTWRAYGGTGMPHEASREEQIAVAKRVQADQGWGAWPACTAKLGIS